MILYGRGFRGLIRSGVLFGAALLSLSACARSKTEIANDELGLFSSEWAFRLNATRRVVPEYPAEALRAGAQGAVVLSLYHDGEGNASQIKVLQSPHPAISDAATEAAKQWKWRKFVSGGIARPVRGKLTFYFVIEDGEGRVENPRIIAEEEKRKEST
jgi:TonB family protein